MPKSKQDKGGQANLGENGSSHIWSIPSIAFEPFQTWISAQNGGISVLQKRDAHPHAYLITVKGVLLQSQKVTVKRPATMEP